MFTLRLVAVTGMLLLAAACGSSSAPTAPSPSPSPSPSPAPTGTASPVAIPVGAASLGNRAYTPDDVTIAAGDTVTWTNTDAIVHTSTSNGAGWDSGTVAPGGRFSFTFRTAGTFPYHCAIHPGMVGTVVVR